jgi:hypothetical protein
MDSTHATRVIWTIPTIYLKRGPRGPPRKFFWNFFIAAHDFWHIYDDINLSLIHRFCRQKMLKLNAGALSKPGPSETGPSKPGPGDGTHILHLRVKVSFQIGTVRTVTFLPGPQALLLISPEPRLDLALKLNQSQLSSCFYR